MRKIANVRFTALSICLLSLLARSPETAAAPLAAESELTPPRPFFEDALPSDANAAVAFTPFSARSGASIQVINGKDAEARVWSALLQTQQERNVGGSVTRSTCSAALVGPNVLLTAAHCVDKKDSAAKDAVRIVRIDGVADALSCEMHPDYASANIPVENTPRSQADYALCLTKDKFTAPASGFEVIDVGTAPTTGSQVLITGYGCTKIAWVDGRLVTTGANGVLRVGGSKIAAPAAPPLNWMTAVADLSKDDTAICPGDSGGPLFSGATAKDQDARRRVIAVNSALYLEKSVITSYFSSLSAPAFSAFLTQWLSEKGHEAAQVCATGLTSNTGQVLKPAKSGCRA